MPDMPLSEAIVALRRVHVESVLLPIVVQLILILLVARAAAAVARKLGQSGVVGEIAAGLILGPSLLSQFHFVHRIFHPGLPDVPDPLADQIFHWIFTILAQLGLVMLLFLIGLEFDFSHLRWNGKAAFAISLAGIALPFALGLGITPVLLGSADLGTHPAADGPPNFWHFGLFLGTALSITALPILGRLMIELNIHRTRLGAITITAAAVDDAVGWILLAAVAALVQSSATGVLPLQGTAIMLGQTVAFALAMIFVVRPVLTRLFARLMRGGELGTTGLALVLAAMMGCSIVTNLIGIFAIFGAFLCGAILSDQTELRRAIRMKLRDFVTAFFLPIFFTYTGLRTNVAALGSAELWLLCGLVLAAAVFGKFGGCFVAAKLSGFPTRESVCVATMMNTRALMELIVINVGYDLRVLPPSVFAMLVLMALTTTVMTTPLLLRFLRGTECEASLAASPMMRVEETTDDE